MFSQLEVDDVRLAVYVAEPEGAQPRRMPGLVLCHGFPSGTATATAVSESLHELADRIAAEMGWLVSAPSYRGCGKSSGDFSLGGWLADTRAALDDMARRNQVTGVWLAGFGTGGAMALLTAGTDERVRGVATVGTPADFADWAEDPDDVLAYARRRGIVTDDEFPPDLEAWSAELAELKPVAAADALTPRPLLVLHGADDDAVPVFDARAIADAHGGADLRVVGGAGHGLRHDPRAVAILLNWLDNQRHRQPA